MRREPLSTWVVIMLVAILAALLAIGLNATNVVEGFMIGVICAGLGILVIQAIRRK